MDDLTGSVDELVKGAEKGLTARGRSVREAVGERLPATQEDIRELRAELRAIPKKLEVDRAAPTNRQPHLLTCPAAAS